MDLELVIQPVNPLAIIGNFDELKAEMIEGLKVYEIEVTEDNLAEAKKMAADLNRLSTSIKTTKNDKAREYDIPVAAFKAKCKELEDMAQASREKILAQVKVFEDKRRESCKVAMASYLANHYGALQVRPEYQNGFNDIPGLVGLSKIGKENRLTKEGRDAMESLAKTGRMAQEKADGRMARVEADCHISGVQPLTREHVASFIDADDTVFAAKLNSMIKAEVSRLEAQKEKIRKEEEAKARAKVEAENKILLEKERADKELADKMEADRKKAVADLQKFKEAQAKPVETPQEITVSVPEIPQNQEAPAADPQEEKKIMPFQFQLIISVSAKVTADPARVRKVISEIISKAVLASDPRIGKVEVQ